MWTSTMVSWYRWHAHSTADDRWNRVWSMWIINFWSWFYSFTFGWINYRKSNISTTKSTGDLWVLWVLIWYFKAWLLSHVKMTFAFACSDFTWKLRYKSDELPDTIQEVTITPCLHNTKTYQRSSLVIDISRPDQPE